MKRALVTALGSLIFAGCITTSQVLEMGKETYSVSSTADGLSEASTARGKAFEKGKAHCTKLGKQFLFLSESSTPTRMGIDTTISVTFRCLNENDPALH